MNTKFICEVGSNHNQSLDKCLEFIDTAKELGCWGIKFQMFNADLLWTKQQTINSVKVETECVSCHPVHWATGKYSESDDDDKTPVILPSKLRYFRENGDFADSDDMLWGDGNGEKHKDYIAQFSGTGGLYFAKSCFRKS